MLTSGIKAPQSHDFNKFILDEKNRTNKEQRTYDELDSLNRKLAEMGEKIDRILIENLQLYIRNVRMKNQMTKWRYRYAVDPEQK